MEESFDPVTGEVLTDDTLIEGRAADGGLIPAAARTGGDIINQMEDGEFQLDLHAAVVDMVQHLNDVANANGGKAKGTVNIKLVFSKEDNAFRVASTFDVKKPPLPRKRSIMWTDEHGNLTRFPPNQMQMFGLKSVGGSGGLRRV